VWKDNQLKRTFGIDGEKRAALLQAINDDAAFLREHDCIDYSLFVCVHTVGDATVAACTQDVASPAAAVALIEANGGIVSKDGKEIFFIGIIDFLSRYGTLAKKGAHFFKRFLWTNAELSTVNAKYYADRFDNYLPTIVGVVDDDDDGDDAAVDDSTNDKARARTMSDVEIAAV
jgi:hypothetical protein